MDANISTRAASLHTLEALLLQIEAAADNVALIALLDSGATALNDITRQAGAVEEVEEVLERVREAGEDADEISRVVAGGLGAEVDDVEVEGELDDLLREQEEKERMRALREYDRRVREAEGKARREAEELARRLGGVELDVGGKGESKGEKERERERENEVVS